MNTLKSRIIRTTGLALTGISLSLLLLASTRAAAQPFSIWNDSAVPAIAAANDPGPVEVGLKFSSAANGVITAIRFYKGESNTGTHMGSLWAADGTLLASVAFENETPVGWQTQALPVPVPILANTPYVVSYHAPVGQYAVNLGYFLTGVDTPPLRALADGEFGGNGVYAYGPSGTFPNQTFSAANYWVDVLMVPQDQTPPIITCPPDAVLSCDACITDPASTGMPSVTDDSSYTLGYSDVVISNDCPLVVERTWTATDAALNSASCVQMITCLQDEDQTPPVITCPPNVVSLCDGCNTDPANTGFPTVTDESEYTLDYVDLLAVEGCPQLVERTWTATDAAGNSASCLQTITCLPPALVTDSSGCIFDRDPATSIQDFRLIFIQDPQNWPCFRLVASNPGQYVYNVFYTGTPGADVSFDLVIPYPFVTQGANPIHAYDGVSLTACGDQLCVQPGNAILVSSQQVTLADYGSGPLPFTSIPVSLTVPDSGLVHLAVHLDFGLKKTTGYLKNLNDDAVDCATGSEVLIPNHASLEFSVAGALTGSTSIQNINAFKKAPGIAGIVLSELTEDPVPGATVTLFNARHVSVGSAVTDQDGFYMIPYKHTGRAATYYVRMAAPPPSDYVTVKPVSIKANAFIRVDFLVP